MIVRRQTAAITNRVPSIFLRSDDGIAKTHYVVYSPAVPAAPSEYMTYWQQNGLIADNDEQLAAIMGDFMRRIADDPNSREYVLSVKLDYQFDSSSDNTQSVVGKVSSDTGLYPKRWFSSYREGTLNFFAQF